MSNYEIINFEMLNDSCYGLQLLIESFIMDLDKLLFTFYKLMFSLIMIISEIELRTTFLTIETLCDGQIRCINEFFSFMFSPFLSFFSLPFFLSF